MANCRNPEIQQACFIPNDTAIDPVSILHVTVYDDNGAPIASYYQDEAGNAIDPSSFLGGGLATIGECSQSIPECVESQEWTYGIDNTGTRFNDVADYVITLSDGSTLNFSQDGSSASWTAQLTEWAANIQTAADNAGLAWFVEPRFIDNYNPTNIDGTVNGPGGSPSGLPGAASVPVAQALFDGGMIWRYVNIQICPGQPVPSRAERISSQQFTNNPYSLTTAGAVLGPIQKFIVCRECGQEPTWYLSDGVTLADAGQIPNCYEPCGTLTLTEGPPDRECNFEIDVACDNNNSNDINDFTNTITRRSTICNGEQIAVDYFAEDPNDPAALIPYTLNGDFVDCATGEVIEEPKGDVVVVDCEGNEEPVSFDQDVRLVGSINPIETFSKEYFTYFELQNSDGNLRNREWHDTFNVTSTTNSTTEFGALQRENHNFSLTPDADTLVSSLSLNDTDNTAAEGDVQVLEGFIVVTPETTGDYLYTANSEGYFAVELGRCCGEFELVAELGKNVGVNNSPTFNLPVGIHKIRIWNIDSGGTNSSWNLVRPNIDGSTTTVNTLFDVSTTKPVWEKKYGYICNDLYYSLDDVELDFTESNLSLCDIKCESGFGPQKTKFPSGPLYCYGQEESASYDIGTDNESDGSFSIGGTSPNTQMKWEVESPASASDGLSDVTLAAQSCIDGGQEAVFTITDQDGLTYSFTATTYTAGNTDGSGGWLFAGAGGGVGGSGKIRSASVTCGTSSKAYGVWDCDLNAVTWYDYLTNEQLSQEQVSTLNNCPVETISECPEFSTVEQIACASEQTTTVNGTTVNVGDEIFKIIQVDCENVVQSSVSYHVISNEFVENIFTEECDPASEIEVVRLCLLDTNGVEWTQINIIDPNDIENPTVIYYDEFNVVGTPAGEASEWTSCEGQYVSYENVKLCEIDARFLLLIDSGGVFARYSFYTGIWENVSTLSVSSAGGSADVENFLLYNFVAPDQLTRIDVNTDTQLANLTLIDGVINPNVTTNPKTFSAASFRDADGYLYAQDTGGADAGLYRVNVTTGEVDFVTTITGVSGTGTSIMIDNTTDTLIVNGSNLSYQVDWNTGVATLWGNPPIQPNGGTFDTDGNAYVTQGNNTYSLAAGLDPNNTDNWVQIIDDFAAGANSIAYYEVIAPQPSCFNRRFGVRPDGSRDVIGDFNIIDDSPRNVVGDVDCCECTCGGSSDSGGSGGAGGEITDVTPNPDQTHVLVSGTGNVPAGLKTVTINNLSGITIINGGFELGSGRRVDSISFDATEIDRARGLLPAMTITGGTHQWIGLQPIDEV